MIFVRCAWKNGRAPASYAARTSASATKSGQSNVSIKTFSPGLSWQEYCTRFSASFVILGSFKIILLLRLRN